MTPMQQFVAVAGAARRAAGVPRSVVSGLGGMTVREARGALHELEVRLLRLVGQHVDLTPLVSEVVDLDRLVARVDIDAVAQRLDIDAVLDRLDMVTLVESVIADIDLPEIIRQSSGAMASDTLTGVRLQGISADAAVARAVSRLRPHGRRVRADDAPAPVRP